MATPPLPPQPVVFRGQPRVASQVQDSTLATYKATQNVLSSNASSIAALQNTTAQGTIANGVLVLATIPNGTYQLVQHNLGRVASGFIVVSTLSAPISQYSSDPGAPVLLSTGLPGRNSTQPTQQNPTPTKTIRLYNTAGSGTATFAVWVF